MVEYDEQEITYQIYNGDCLKEMQRLEDDSVDMILCDLPYNLTDAAFDKHVIDLSAMWTQFKYRQTIHRLRNRREIFFNSTKENSKGSGR